MEQVCFYVKVKGGVNMNRLNNIYINQKGYITSCNKIFITTENCRSFNIIKTDGEIVFSGKLKLSSKLDKSTGEKLYKGDFSRLREKGTYIVKLDNGNESYSFEIGESVYNDVLYKTLKSFYFQRCGSPLLEEYAGEFHREICHNDPVPYHPSLGIDGSKDVTGGWHDAGDYGRYITPGAVALAPMLLAYEQYPEKFGFSCIGLPESSNGKSDFFNEVKYELDWMFKMQETDVDSPMLGALHYMINSPGYIWDVPENDKKNQCILGYCSIATADFAATMACASRIFKNIDADFSKKALERALLAWDFLENRESSLEAVFIRPEDIGTGGYAEDPKNNTFSEMDKLWPSVELYLTTGNEKYHEICKSLFKDKKSSYGDMSWIKKTGFAEIKYILSKKEDMDKKLRTKLTKRFIGRCNSFVKISIKDGFSTLLEEKDYQWGSNSELFSRALQLIMAHEITGKSHYKEISLNQINYLLGMNINSISYVVGVGSRYPKNIHHASFDNDGIDQNFPGMIPGGPNRNVENSGPLFDKALYKKCPPGTPGAKCYIDDVGSFSSNENCITYTAPILSVIAYFTSA